MSASWTKETGLKQQATASPALALFKTDDQRMLIVWLAALAVLFAAQRPGRGGATVGTSRSTGGFT